MLKLSPFKDYINFPEKVKMLTKCLYLIEAIAENKVDDLYEAFEEKIDFLMEIKLAYSNNRKINEIINHIIKIYNPSFTEDGYSAMQNKGNQSEVNQPSNPSLLDIGDNKESNQNTNDNLLGDIFGNTSNNSNPVNNNNNILLDFGIGNNTSSNSNDFMNSISPNIQNNYNNIQSQNQPQTSQKKGFNFIKNKAEKKNDNNQNNTNETSNKGFSFIKNQNTKISADNNENKGLNEDLNSIFGNINIMPQMTTSGINQNLNQPLQNIDMTKIKSEPKFNYDLVYQNTQALKGEQDNKNDPFNFVDDMIKTKKK